MTEEETTMEIKEDHTEKNDSPVKRQGPSGIWSAPAL